MGAYYLTYIDREIEGIDFVVEQGQEIGRDGRVRVIATRDESGIDVTISGTAVYVREFDIIIE